MHHCEPAMPSLNFAMRSPLQQKLCSPTRCTRSCLKEWSEDKDAGSALQPSLTALLKCQQSLTVSWVPTIFLFLTFIIWCTADRKADSLFKGFQQPYQVYTSNWSWSSTMIQTNVLGEEIHVLRSVHLSRWVSIDACKRMIGDRIDPTVTSFQVTM